MIRTKGKDKIPNPHMHIMVPIRPLQEDGTWGTKQKKVPVLTPDGQPVLNQKGQPVFRAVHTTDWSRKETLEELRSAWARMCNELYEEKGLTEESMPDLMRNGGLIRSRWCMKDRTYRQWKQEEFQPHWEV